MKKNLGRILLAIMCCFALISFVGCSDDNHATDSPDSLQFNVKYYYYTRIHDNKNGDATYYIFYSNGTCMRHEQSGTNYDSGYRKTSEYKTYFKYTYMDEQKTGVALFFHSKEYTKYNADGTVLTVDTTPTDSESKSSNVYSVSKNIISGVSLSGGYHFYINENYVGEIPNYYPEKK